jgi:hypothetical protein
MALVDVAGWSVAPLVVVVVLLAATLHTFGELWHASGQFCLALGLADAQQMGRYQGVFNLGEAIAGCLAPLFVGYLCTGAGAPGWLVLGVVVAVAGLMAGPAVRAADKLHHTVLTST